MGRRARSQAAPDFDVVARAAVQARAALEATVELGGGNDVFRGGREGYASLLNTQMKRELEDLARSWPRRATAVAASASPATS